MPNPIKNVLVFLLIGVVSISLNAISAQGAHFYPGLWWLSTKNLPSSGTGDYSFGGFGISYEYRTEDRFGLEIAGYFQPTILNGESTRYALFPLSLRLWMTRESSISIGGFYRFRMGSSSQGAAATDYGLRSTIGFDYPMGHTKAISFSIEAGYQLSLANTETAIQQNQIIVLIGLRFGRVYFPSKADPLPALPYTPVKSY
jgi:hypothetical protein